MPARELLSRYNDVDVVIIEGYKTEGFDNIVVARSGVDRLRGKELARPGRWPHRWPLPATKPWRSGLRRRLCDDRAININGARAICDLIQDHLA